MTRRKTPARRRASNLVVAVREAVEDMPWLEPSDQAAVETIVRMAESIEDMIEAGCPAELVAKQARLTGPKILDGLALLGGAGPKGKPARSRIGGRLAHLRAARTGTEDGDE